MLIRRGNVIYCVTNENIIVNDNVYHVRQIKQARDSDRYSPLAKNNKAIIRVKYGKYFGFINNSELIALSTDIDEVGKRLKKVERSIRITVRYDNRNFSIEGYKLTKLPKIYRMTYSNTVDHGLIIAIETIHDGNYSPIRLFYDMDKAIKHIRSGGGKDENYYVFCPRETWEGFREEVGGLDNLLDLNRDMRTIRHLRAEIMKRQKAGSHEEYIAEQRRKRNDEKVISFYGSKQNVGIEDVINDDEESEIIESDDYYD